MNPRSVSPLSILVITLLLLVIITPVTADSTIPTKTTVYFEQNGRPFDGPVSFNVSCYGYMCRDYACHPDPGYGERAPRNAENVFAYSASCPGYGCAIYQPFYVNHRHITWCDMAGTANGTPFIIRNVSESPIPDCTYDLPFDTEQNNTYYRYPPEYRACLKEREQDKTAICGRYIEAATWAEIEKTPGLSWYANNGTYWIRTPAYLACISRMELESLTCGSEYPLQPVDPSSFATDPAGQMIGNYCTLRVALPAPAVSGENATILPVQSVIPVAEEKNPAPVSSPAPAGRSVIDRIACWFADRFSGGCL